MTSSWASEISTLSLSLRRTKNILEMSEDKIFISMPNDNIDFIFLALNEVSFIFFEEITFRNFILWRFFLIIMISTKLNKNAVAGNLMIEFSDIPLHPVLEKFYLNCKDEGVLVRRSSFIEENQMNLHLVDLEEHVEVGTVTLKNVPNNFCFVITANYVFNEE